MKQHVVHDVDGESSGAPLIFIDTTTGKEMEKLGLLLIIADNWKPQAGRAVVSIIRKLLDRSPCCQDRPAAGGCKQRKEN